MIASVGQIWVIASTEPTRMALNHVSFDAEAGTLTATDSYVAARVPCKVEDGDESGLIPATALKEANGQSLRIADGKATLKLSDGGERTWPLSSLSFPDIAKILDGAPKAPVRFGINARLLHNLATAMKGKEMRDNAIILHPVHPLKGLRVDGFHEEVGMIMPVRLPNGEVPDKQADFSDEAIVRAAKVTVAALGNRRGKKRAAQAFRDAVGL
jgi:hypothetical protein